MIAQFDHKAGAWVASGNGNLRPIVVEDTSRSGAVKAYEALFDVQLAEEYAYCESMSHLSDISDPNWSATSGASYEQ